MDEPTSSSSFAVENKIIPFKTLKKPFTKKRSLSAEIRNTFPLENIKAEVRCWKVLLDYLRGKTGASTKTKDFKQICGLCLAEPKEQKLLLKFRKAGLRRLHIFLINIPRKECQTKDIKLLTWSCLSLLSFYSRHLNQGDECICFKTQKFKQSKAVFRCAMHLILPEKEREVIKHTIRYVTVTEQWNTEDYDLFIFQVLFTMVTKPEFLLAKIIKQVETSQREEAVVEAVNISCTLSNLLEHAYWDKYLFNNLLHNCFNTLLKLYLLGSSTAPSNHKIDNAKLRLVMKTCIKYFISNITDNTGLVSLMDAIAKCLQDKSIEDGDRIEITEMIAFAAQKHKTKFYRESLTPDLLNLLLSNLLSNEKNLAMISHKIFHHFLNRHGNIKHFSEPVYYFKGRADFTVNRDYGIEDTHFFKSFSRKFFEGIHHCFLTFCDKYELINSYITLCLVLVEIPEPVITINIIHIIIKIQNDILKTEYNMTIKSHIHAILSALMSLICVIHQEEVSSLAKYVDEVVKFRTENSPHLLPPLQNKYSVASHHTTDYHFQLYFMEEEVLYALQRCWLARRVTGSK